MEIQRVQLAEKIRAFLTDEISQGTVYEWALSQAVMPLYEEVAADDPLFREGIQALININHDEDETRPTREELEYYYHCLVGNGEFVPREIRLSRKTVGSKLTTKGEYRRDIFLSFRVYVIIFALVSLGVNVYGVINPDFLKIGGTSPERIQVFIEAIPHIVYSVVLLLPFAWLVQRFFYYFTLFAVLIGAVYYWVITLTIIYKWSLSWFMVFPIASFLGVPASLALIVLLEERKRFCKIRREERKFD